MSDWMQEALFLARQAGIADEVPVGAVLVKDGQVIGRGANTRERDSRVVAHAEIQALEDYSARTGQWRLMPGTELYVTVEPCLMCVGALLWARVDSVHFGCCDPKGAGLLTVFPLIERGVYDHRFKSVEAGVHQTEAAQLMKDFFRLKRRNRELISEQGKLSTVD